MVPGKRRRQGIALAIAQERRNRNAVAVVVAADAGIHAQSPRLAGRRVQAHVQNRVRVVASGHRRASHGKRIFDALVTEVERRPKVRAVAPHKPVVEVPVSALVVAVEVPVALVAGVGLPLGQAELAFHLRGALHERGELAKVAPRNEPHGGIEASAHFRVAGVVGPGWRVVVAEQRHGMHVVGITGASRLRHEPAQHGVVANAPAPVHAKGLLVVRLAAIGADEADGGAIRQIAAHAQHGEIRLLGRLRRRRAHVQKSHVGAGAQAPGEPGATVDGQPLAIAGDADAPAVEQQHFGRTGLKGPGVLQEERPRFREEQAEAAKVHLLAVRFHLREIGVVGEV